MAASFFSPVRLVGVIGSDCPFDLADIFADRNVDLAGLEVRKQSKTFRWTGSYRDTMNEVITEARELNVLAEAPPKVPAEYKDSGFVFLANTAPILQLEMLEQLDSPCFVAADTMNCWIESELDDLKRLLKKIDCLVINEIEARMLAGHSNLVISAEAILEMGPDIVVIKKGESGSIMCDKNGEIFVLLAFPATEIKDPTGAGDSFAGGLMGYLAQSGKTDFATLKTAIAYGTVVASFTIADFSLRGLTSISKADIDSRFETLRRITSF
jgi:sugar/nucleoside kinase (ribokinase family)